MFVEAKSQQRPEEPWSVMGPPSRGMRTLKTWGSGVWAAGEARTVSGFAVLRAESASLGMLETFLVEFGAQLGRRGEAHLFLLSLRSVSCQETMVCADRP